VIDLVRRRLASAVRDAGFVLGDLLESAFPRARRDEEQWIALADALADAEAERDAWEPVELTLHYHPPAAHPKRFIVGTESPAAAMNLDVNITDPADRWDQ